MVDWVAPGRSPLAPLAHTATPSASEKTAPSHSSDTRGRVFGCHYRSHVRFEVEGHAGDAATNAPPRGL